MRHIFEKYQEPIVTGLLIAFSLGFIAFFRNDDDISLAFQSVIVSIVFFLVIPLLYCKIVLRKSLKNLGWQKGDIRAGIAFGLGSVVAAVLAIFLLAKIFPALPGGYSLPLLVESNFLWFVLYEFVLVLFVAFLNEVFFRGMVQTLWLGKMGWRAVLLQAGIFFGLFLITTGMPSWQDAPLLLFTPFAGLIAYRSGSIWYSLGASWLFFLLTDIIFLILR